MKMLNELNFEADCVMALVYAIREEKEKDAARGIKESPFVSELRDVAEAFGNGEKLEICD